MKQWSLAAEAYAAALQENDQNPGIYINLGFVRHENGNYNGAIESYNQALKLKKDWHIALKNLGVTYRKIGWFDEAICCFERAIRKDPNYGGAWHQLIGSLNDAGKIREALDIADKAVLAEIDLPNMQAYRANLYDRYGSKILPEWGASAVGLCFSPIGSVSFVGAYQRQPWLVAAEGYRRAIQLDCTKKPFVMKDLGRLYFKVGDSVEAIRILAARLEIAPEDAEARQLLKQAQDLQRRRELGGLQERSRRDPLNLIIRYEIGRLHDLLGEPEIAESFFREATMQKPPQLRGSAIFALGTVLKEQGNFIEALPHLVDGASILQANGHRLTGAESEIAACRTMAIIEGKFDAGRMRQAEQAASTSGIVGLGGSPLVSLGFSTPPLFQLRPWSFEDLPALGVLCAEKKLYRQSAETGLFVS
jgi:tetratricopeptide (TPR) repeat protein